MDAQSGSRTLSAANDFIELLRLAHGAAERLASELHGAQFEHAELLQREIHRLRRSADELLKDTERFVADQETASLRRGHPLRRATDRRVRA